MTGNLRWPRRVLLSGESRWVCAARFVKLRKRWDGRMDARPLHYARRGQRYKTQCIRSDGDHCTDFGRNAKRHSEVSFFYKQTILLLKSVHCVNWLMLQWTHWKSCLQRQERLQTSKTLRCVVHSASFGCLRTLIRTDCKARCLLRNSVPVCHAQRRGNVMLTDSVSREDKAVGSVRPYFCPWVFVNVWVMTIARLGLKVKVRVQYLACMGVVTQ